MNAELPNILGETGMDGITPSTTNEGVLWGGSGAFQTLIHVYENTVAVYAAQNVVKQVKRFYFNASEQNTIYSGKNVIPSSLSCKLFIKY